MSADSVTPIKGDGEFTTVEFRNIVRLTMDPETALHSLHALLVVIKELNAGDAGTFQGEIQALAYLGEYIADQLTDRL